MTTVTVSVDVNGVRVPLALDDVALAAIAAATTSNGTAPTASAFLTIPEAADLLRCSRQRVDDLLSQRRLTRVKDGRRTLIRRGELESYLDERRSR